MIDHTFINDIPKMDKLIFDWHPVMFTYKTMNILTASGSRKTTDQSASRMMSWHQLVKKVKVRSTKLEVVISIVRTFYGDKVTCSEVRLQRSLWIYTVGHKKLHPFISAITLSNCIIFWKFLVHRYWSKFATELQHNCPPLLMAVSTLPCEI